MATTARSRRTQEERTSATRKALLDATVECLVEYGYHGTTTTRIVQRAGVSRGAQVHHFPTKTDLVLAAVQHLAVKRATAFLESDIDRLRRADDWVSEALDVLWEAHQGPLFDASMELWIASRTDPELREHMASFERMVTASILEIGRTVLGGLGGVTDSFVYDLTTSLETIRGLRMVSFVHPSSEEKIAERWQRSKDRLRQFIHDPMKTG